MNLNTVSIEIGYKLLQLTVKMLFAKKNSTEISREKKLTI